MTNKLPSFWSILWVSLVLCTVGYGGLIFLLFLTLPDLFPRWLFFFLLTIAVSGSALPVTYFLNRRFPTDPPVESGVVLREAMWFGIFASLLAWLQMGQVLTSGLIVVLGSGLLLVEFLLRMSERSQWSPSKTSASSPADLQPDDAPDEDLEGEEEDA